MPLWAFLLCQIQNALGSLRGLRLALFQPYETAALHARLDAVLAKTTAIFGLGHQAKDASTDVYV